MVNKKHPFQWDEQKEKVAEALAKGDLTHEQVSSQFGVGRTTLWKWMKVPEFQRKIDEIVADIDVAMKAERIKIAKKEIRRVMKRLELNEDKPGSRDLVALLKYVGEEVGDYTEAQKTIKIIWDNSDNINQYQGEETEDDTV